jgi:hypothetical protein
MRGRSSRSARRWEVAPLRSPRREPHGGGGLDLVKEDGAPRARAKRRCGLSWTSIRRWRSSSSSGQSSDPPSITGGRRARRIRYDLGSAARATLACALRSASRYCWGVTVKRPSGPGN